MVLGFVIVYMVITVAIGYGASRLVRSSRDFIVAGRRLPLYMTTFALFATWFGAETMLGASTRVQEEGLMGAVEDPLGASLCLFLIGAFFARPLYRSNLYTFGDFFRARYDRANELLSSLFIVISYFGWVAAQIVALGIMFNAITGLPIFPSMLIGASLVVFYTFLGGMWAVSITDFVQTLMILGALFAVCWVVADKAGGIAPVLADRPEGFFSILPEPGFRNLVEYLTAWSVIGLGSIPQQDLFQRINSAKSERVAVWGAYLGGLMYLTVAVMPLFLALAVRNIDPALYDLPDRQLVLPALVRIHTSPLVQVFFYGALLSAILSTASAAILAPSVILSENFLKPLLPRLSDRQFLWLTRGCVLVISAVSIALALPASGAGTDQATPEQELAAAATGHDASGKVLHAPGEAHEGEAPAGEAEASEAGLPSIFELVADSYTSTLVALLVPLTLGVYWRRGTAKGSLAAMAAGIATWALLKYALDLEWTARLAGLLASLVAMVAVSLLDRPPPASSMDWLKPAAPAADAPLAQSR